MWRNRMRFSESKRRAITDLPVCYYAHELNATIQHHPGLTCRRCVLMARGNVMLVLLVVWVES